MTKIDCKEIAYYGKPIDSLTQGELINAIEELARAIHECAARDKKCETIIQVKKGSRAGMNEQDPSNLFCLDNPEKTQKK